MTARKIPTIVTHDGRTIRYPDPDVKALDTVKVDLTTGKVVDFIPFATGNLVMLTQGHNIGRVGTIDIVHIKDVAGQTFATRLGNVFVIGKGEDAWVTLPKGNGVKRPIVNVK